ncbi:monocarboxylate transporter 12-like [Ptychodera flava]|uniref:monocarboxylate transporter 12-like n=1 Tax=Ptychodera flava TaxID=63121 RepID=UPI00396AA185
MDEHNSPDGSIRGWLVVAASFTIHMYYIGIVQTSGLFMIEFLRYFDEAAGTVSWMFTTAGLVIAAIAPTVGYLVSKFGAQKVAAVGAIIATVGMLLSAFAQSLAHLMVTFGVLHAIGLTAMFIPALSIVAQYFTKRYALANGLAALGASVGSMAIPPMSEALMEHYGWHGAFLIISGIAANILVAAVIMKPAPRERNKVSSRQSPAESENVDSEKEDCTIEGDHNLKNCLDTSNSFEETDGISEHRKEIVPTNPNCTGVVKVFTLIPRFCGCSLIRKYPLYGSFLIYIILYTSSSQMGMIWRVVHAVAVGIPRMKAATLATFFGVSSVIGRVGHGCLVDSKIISPMTLLSLTLTVLSISILVFTFLERYAFMAACCAVIGLCQGVSTTLDIKWSTPLVIVCLRHIVGVKDLPRAIGVQFAAYGLSGLSLPVAGKLYEMTEDTRSPFYLSFACASTSTLIVLAMAFVQRRKSKDSAGT